MVRINYLKGIIWKHRNKKVISTSSMCVVSVMCECEEFFNQKNIYLYNKEKFTTERL